jgi:hypothetical protein
MSKDSLGEKHPELDPAPWLITSSLLLPHQAAQRLNLELRLSNTLYQGVPHETILIH